MANVYLCEPENLKFVLAPVLCKSIEQQQLMYREFDSYLKERQRPLLVKYEIEKEPLWNIYKTCWFLLFLGITIFSFVLSLIDFNKDNKTTSTSNENVPTIVAQPSISFEFPKNKVQVVQVGETISFKNTSKNLNEEDTLVWQLINANGLAEKYDTLKFNEDWEIKIDSTGKNPEKRVKLSLFNPAEKYEADSFSLSFIVECKNPPQVNKDNWLNSIVEDSIFSLALIPVDKRPYKYEWKRKDMTEAYPSKLKTLECKIEQPGLYEIGATITLPDADGECVSKIIHPITVTNNQNYVQLKKLKLNKDVSYKAEFKSEWWVLFVLYSLPLSLFWYIRWIQPPLKYKVDLLKNLKEITDAPDKAPYYIPFRPMEYLIDTKKNVYQFANILRQRQVTLRKEIDIEKTLRNTIDKGGFKDVQSKYTTKPIEYLFLIDKQHNNSIQSKLFEHLANSLKNKEVHLDHYFYHGAPYSFWQKNERETYSFNNLYNLYPNHRLVVLGNAYRLINQNSDQSLSLNKDFSYWIEHWKNRCLISPIPSCSWTYKEAILYQLFPIFTADLNGIQRAFEALQIESEEESILPFEHYKSKSVKEHHKDANINYVNWRIPEEIKTYLTERPKLWLWLCALAVHPFIIWQLTVAIGNALKKME